MSDTRMIRLWQCDVTNSRYETGVVVNECPCRSGPFAGCTHTDIPVPSGENPYDIAPDGTVFTARTTIAILQLLRYRPDGTCRRDFADRDIFEPSSRIIELRAAGYTIPTRPCKRHNHRTNVVEYRLGDWPT